MLSKYLVLLFSSLILASLLYSCKNNVNSSTNGIILYSKDTINLSTQGEGVLNLYNEQDYFSPYTNIRKIELDYTGETNIDSSKGICHMIVKVAAQSGGSVPFYMYYDGITSINHSYTYNAYITSDVNLWYVQFRIEINNGFTPGVKYIIMRNIKVVGLE